MRHDLGRTHQRHNARISPPKCPFIRRIIPQTFDLFHVLVHAEVGPPRLCVMSDWQRPPPPPANQWHRLTPLIELGWRFNSNVQQMVGAFRCSAGCRSPLCSRALLPGVKSTATENIKMDTFRTDLLPAKYYMRYIYIFNPL